LQNTCSTAEPRASIANPECAVQIALIGLVGAVALEARLQDAAAVVRAPLRQLGGDHARRPAPLELEREEPVCRPDVEDRLAGQVVGEAVVREQGPVVVLARRDDAVAEVDRVVPGEVAHPRALLVCVHGIGP
jgi:hypothetical protein